MPLKVYRLRRVLAATAILLSLVVVGMYSYARYRARSVLTSIPGKIGYGIKQTARGFQFSKSDGKRTLFTIEASDLKEFKLNGRAELHNVSIVLYGRDSSRFDQIYGDDFAYDPKTGDVTAKGDVQIDLVANPTGLASPDQATPKELKNPIHLKTRDLVFNRESGNASTDAMVEFRTPQATGSAVGVKYAGKSNTLTLSSQIHVVLSAPHAAVIEAQHGVITNEPREITLDHPHLVREGGTLQADQAVFHLNTDNHVESAVATGNVTTETKIASATRTSTGRSHPQVANSATDEPASETVAHADRAEFLLTGSHDLLRTATLTGNVHVEQTGAQPMQGTAGRVVLDFAGQNLLQKIHALEGAHLVQKVASSNKSTTSQAQDFDLTASAIDFAVVKGHILQRAVTSGAAQITVSPVPQQGPSTAPSPSQRTIVTAAKFEAQFAPTEGRNHLTNIHGAPKARIVNETAGKPDRVSTSDSLDAAFLPQGGIATITQQGNVVYTDGQADKRLQAWATTAHYTPADHMLLLSGSPRVVNGGMATTATTIRINRATGDAFADGDVKSSYSDLKEQPNGALLASSSPIHVTAHSMTAHNRPAVALYTGNARLWQDANIIEAPSIQFDRDRRFVTAQGTPTQPVQTILIQKQNVNKGSASSEKTSAKNRTGSENARGKASQQPNSSPLSITAAQLTYADSERKVHYDGGVLAKGADFTASAKTMDAYLLPRSQTSTNQSFAGPGQLDRMVAEGDVVIQEPNRHADGQKLVYTAAEDKFVLTGGPPSIFDAEQGKITGVSLTFFRGDDRVLVEGEASTPVVTTTRVAH
jgi:lipopolysaccharide export system protein LptA